MREESVLALPWYEDPSRRAVYLLWGHLWVGCFKILSNCGYSPQPSEEGRTLQAPRNRQPRLPLSNVELGKYLAVNRRVVGSSPT